MSERTSLAEELPKQIARVTAKKERWLSDHAEMTNILGPQKASGMLLTIKVMQAEIEEGVAALASGDVARMLAAHQTLKDYSDED